MKGIVCGPEQAAKAFNFLDVCDEFREMRLSGEVEHA